MKKGKCAAISAMAIALLAIGAAPAHAEPAVALLDGNVLIHFDTATPGTITATTAVSGLGADQKLRGIDVRPATGRLFGTAVTTGSANNSVVFTYAIDPATAQATLVGQTAAGLAGAADIPTGFDFNPAVDRMRYVNTNDENARMNPNNGVLSGNDTDLTPAGTTEIIAAAYDRNTPASSGATLYEIDRDTSTLSIQGGPNGSVAPGQNGGVVTDLVSLGFVLNAANDGGLDITPNGTGFAALSNIGTGITGLYNLTLGLSTTLVGPIGTGADEVYSLAILPPDDDGDANPNVTDNCPNAANTDQADLDADGVGDVCDDDQDGDGLSDAFETAIGTDPRSTNSDGDSVPDATDACPSLPGSMPNGCPDIALPETLITAAPKKKTSKHTATLEFGSTEQGSSFACSLDHRSFKPCTSPHKLRNLSSGKHSFEVRAIDAAGNLDPTPASRAWRIKERARK